MKVFEKILLAIMIVSYIAGLIVPLEHKVLMFGIFTIALFIWAIVDACLMRKAPN